MTAPGILVSACLLGQPVRYDGGARGERDDEAWALARLRDWAAQGRVRLLALCPEVAGGLPVPRPAAEIQPGHGGIDVLRGQAWLGTRAGGPDAELTRRFVDGAHRALALMRAQHGVAALLTPRSPSCGAEHIYDGRFEGRLVAGEGVTAALLREQGYAVFHPAQIDALDRWLRDRAAARDAGPALR